MARPIPRFEDLVMFASSRHHSTRQAQRWVSVCACDVPLDRPFHNAKVLQDKGTAF